jgi:hypothetical protein
MSNGFFDQHGTWIPQADQPRPNDSRPRCPDCDSEMTDQGDVLVCAGCGTDALADGGPR